MNGLTNFVTGRPGRGYGRGSIGCVLEISAIANRSAKAFELRMTFGADYRVYYASEHEHLILLLGGGDKSTQARDIEKAKAAWADYRSRNDD